MPGPSRDPVASPAGGAAIAGTGRVGNVDVLRAVAALAIVAGHAYLLGGRQLPLTAEFAYDVPLISTSSGVWLFFGVSGYVIARPFVDALCEGRALPAIGPYAIRRALRIYPLYWVALTTVIVLVGAGATQTWQYPVHYALAHNLVPGRQTALFFVAWTLALEVLFYAAVPLFALALRRARRLSPERLARLVLASWAMSTLFTLAAGVSGEGDTSLWLRQSFPAMWQMFCPGMLVAIAPHLREPRWRRWLVELPRRPAALGLAAAVLIAAALLTALAPLGNGIRLYQVVADSARPLFAAGFGLVVLAAVNGKPWFQRRGRWVLHLGLISYGIYLLHAVVLNFLLDERGNGLIPLPHGGLGAYLVHLAFLLALTIPLAMLSWRVLEKPLIGVGSRLAQRRRGVRVGGLSRG